MKKVDIEADILAIKQILEKWEATINAGDFEGWISLWANDGVQMGNGGPSRSGVKQITADMKPSLEQFIYSLKIFSVEEARVFGDIGLTRCRFSLTLTPKTGGDKIIAEPDGKALTIYQRQSDDEWKVIYDCFNSNVSPIQE